MIPLHNRVLLKQLENARDELWLPPEAGHLQRGIVLEVGEATQYCGKGDVVLFKTDEALPMRVPIENNSPTAQFARFGAQSVDPGNPEFPTAGAVATEETLFLVDEPFVYLILEKAPS